jgi:hypothetical protein
VTNLDVYQPAAVTGYQPGMIMDEKAAQALDEQVRRCTAAVLREGTDYGIIPGTNGEKTLWRPGAQKLLQWFGLGYTCERVEVERDDDGRKHGITYKCTVGRRLPDGTIDIKATCEGTADYDESKFYQTAEQVQRKAEDRERAWAAKDGRPARPTKWQGLPEYRADWNALMKRAQKRAIVGAVVDATAAGGIFTDREEDDSPAPPQDDGPTWYEQALEQALSFTDIEAGRTLYAGAAQAHRDGLCTRRQQDHIQNRVTQRVRLLKKAAPADAEDLATQAARLVSGGVSVKTAAAGDDTRSQPRAGAQAPRPDGAGGSTAQDATPRAAGAAPDRGAQPLPPLPGEDDEAPAAAVPDETPASGPAAAAGPEPGEAAGYGTERHQKLIGIVWAHLKRLGYPDGKNETDGEKADRLADVAKLAGVSEIGSTGDLDLGELSLAADTLAKCKNRARLNAILGKDQKGGGDE